MLIHYSCPGCGAEMTYDIHAGKLNCSHCGRTKELEDAVKETESIPENNQEEPPGKGPYRCVNCGGELSTGERTTSTFCEYCGAPLIVGEHLGGERKPDVILPFKIDRDAAEAAFKKWCKNGLFSPNGFTSAKNIQRMKGLYIPYWLFHMETHVEVSGTATRIHIHTHGDTEITETDFYSVERACDLEYLNVPHDAVVDLEDNEMKKLEPFQFGEMQPFKTPYLAGFVSSSYEQDAKTVTPDIKNQVTGHAYGFARGTVNGYATVTLDKKNIDFKNIESSFAFAPVWFLDYNYRGEVYKFMMNGQTGRVAGKPPIDAGRVIFCWLIISAVIFLISMLL